MLGEVTALFCALFWGLSAVLYKRALSQTDPLSANLIRLVPTALIIFLFYLIIFGLEEFYKIETTALIYLILGTLIALGLGDWFYLKSIDHIGVCRSVAISNTYPLFSAFLAYLLIQEKVTIYTMLGMIIIIAGIWFLTAEENDQKIKNTKIMTGCIMALLTAIIWALGIVITAVALVSIDPILANVIRISILIPFLTGVILASGNLKMLKPSSKTWWDLGLAGFFALGVGGFLFLFSLTQIGVARTTVLSSTTPLFSTLLAIFMLKEKVNLRMFLGVLFITSGIILLFAEAAFLATPL